MNRGGDRHARNRINRKLAGHRDHPVGVRWPHRAYLLPAPLANLGRVDGHQPAGHPGAPASGCHCHSLPLAGGRVRATRYVEREEAAKTERGRREGSKIPVSPFLWSIEQSCLEDGRPAHRTS